MDHRFILSATTAMFLILTSANAASQADDLTTKGLGGFAEFEIGIFGQLLRAGETVKKPLIFHDFSLTILEAYYKNFGQYLQVLRVCQYGESVAKDTVQRKDQRNCQRFALANLGRYSEAEALALTDGTFLPSDSEEDSITKANNWSWAAELNLQQGQVSMAISAYRKIIDIVVAGRASEKLRDAVPAVDPEFAKTIKKIRLGSLSQIESFAWDRLADIAYNQQRFDDYEDLVRTILCSGLMKPDTSIGLLFT